MAAVLVAAVRGTARKLRGTLGITSLDVLMEWEMIMVMSDTH